MPIDSPLVLVTCFPVSIHASRWVDLLRGSRYRVVVFPSVLQDYCPEFSFKATVRSRADADALRPGEVGVFDHALIESIADSAQERQRGYMPLRSAVDVTAQVLPSPTSLLAAIDALQPDLIHTLELQHAGYLCLEARLRRGPVFPRWLASSWGSDVYLYRRMPRHRARLEELARHVDVLHSDCVRDHGLFTELGFQGRFFPPVAASGGVDLSTYPDPAGLPPPSQRKSILIKGYHGWAGRGMDILLAVHRIAPRLKGFQIRIMHTSVPMKRAAEALARENDLDVVVDPYFPDHAPAVSRLAQARVVVGYGISDGISTTLLEAMAVGTFCIQADTACGCEWITPGVDGLEVPPHDVAALAEAILRAATDDELVDAPVARNRETVQRRWDLKSVKPVVIGGYDEVLAMPGVAHA